MLTGWRPKACHPSPFNGLALPANCGMNRTSDDQLTADVTDSGFNRRSSSDADVSLAIVALLVFASGCSALVFQVAWMRELRLTFGATTAAVAAVLAIFMAGL